MADSVSRERICDRSPVGSGYDSCVSSDQLSLDHWVSRGYQANIASIDKRVAIVSAQTGQLIEANRPIRSNFRERGFNGFFHADGSSDPWLERSFARVERSVLNEIRLVGRNRCGSKQRAAVANLFAVHLVRSPAYRGFHDRVLSQERDGLVAPFEKDQRLAATYEASFGRPARDGDILELVTRQLASMDARRVLLVQSMARQHNLIADKLNHYHMQVFEIPSELPGLCIADAPVAHVNTRTGRHGFRDDLALGDANLIMGPLTRRVGVCFTARRHNHVVVKTRAQLDLINAVFLRAALTEVACHPDDARAVSHTHRRLDRLPIERLVGAA